MNAVQEIIKSNVSYRIPEAAAQISVSTRTLWRLIRRREIYALRNPTRVTHKELVRWADEKTEQSKRTKRFKAVRPQNQPQQLN